MSTRSSKPRPARPAQTATPAAPTLAQEKADFTAEGAPPPGEVGAGVAPVLPPGGAATPPTPAPPHTPPQTPPKAAAPARRSPPSPAGPVRRASKRNPGAWRGNG